MQAALLDPFLHSPVVIVLCFILCFICLWSSILYLIGIAAGWSALSNHFRKQLEPYGDSKSAGPFFYTVYFRIWIHYSSVIRVIAAADGLYLSVMFPFRVGHPPLRIPWDEIEFSRTKRFWLSYVVLTLGKQERIPLRISERMARSLGILDRIPQAEKIA